jgi:predicted RNA polymerase sigma factor
MTDPHATIRDEVFGRVFNGPGESEPAVRNAVAENVSVPSDLQSLVHKIHAHASQVTDDDVARVQAQYGDDQLFEIIVSAAVGASRDRLVRALAALENA